jgi:hypothetical protein
VFTPSTSTIQYTGTTATATGTTYKNLTLGGTGTYTLPASDVTLRGNLVVTTGATVTKSAANKIVFAIGGGNTQTLTGNATNSDLGIVQVSANSGVSTLSLSSSAKFTSITIDSSQVLTTNANTLSLTAASSIATGSFTPSTGSTIAYVPSQASGTVTLPTGITYYNVQFNKASNTFTAPSGTLTINNNLDVTAGSLDLSANNPTTIVTGATTIGGTLISTSGNLTIGGDWTNNGTFTHNSGTVILVPVSSILQILGSANTTFHNLTSTTAGKTIKFKAGNTVGINNLLTLTGTVSSPIALQSTIDTSAWTINLVSATNGALTFISVKDGACSGQNITTPNETIINLGNNGSCWSFIVRSGGGSGSGGNSGGGTPTGGGGSQGGSGDGSSGGGSGQTGGGSGGGGGGSP